MIAQRTMIAEPPADAATAAAAAPPATCAHCGEPCPADAPHGDGGARFCCAGCRAVHGLIRGSGLGEYYRLREREGMSGVPVRTDARPRVELDAPSFIEHQTELVAPGRRRATLGIDGLRCGACLWLIESLPRLRPGILAVRVDAGRSTVDIDWEPARCRLSEAAHFLERLGYAVLPLRDRQERRASRTADRAWLARLGVAAVIAANTMGIAFALYGGLFHGMDPRLRAFLQWTSLALAAVSVTVPGRIFLRNAWVALRCRVPHMDLPISIALMAALGGGAWSTARGGEGVYAESLAMLVFLLLAGRFVQFRSQRRAREQVELIAALLPGTAKRRRDDGTIEVVPLEALSRGDRVIVASGDVAPADGRVIAGEPPAAWVDLQALTGESRPVPIPAGGRCWAGARILGRPVEIEVEAAGAESRMGQIRALVEEAAARRAPVVEFANRIAGWFLLAVTTLAAATFVAWAPRDPAAALEHTVALLVITCPCALGLATPLAIVASLAKAASAGILIKGGDVLERLSRPGTIVLDKTGTLTEGAMRIEAVEGDASALAPAAELERRSAHPIGRAIVDFASRGADGRADAHGNGARPRDVREVRTAPGLADVTAVEERPGRGIRGRVGGCVVAVGTLDFVGDEAQRRAWRRRERTLASRGLSPVAVAIDGRVAAIAGIGDPLRREAAAVVAALRTRGWRVALLSGDDASIVSGVAVRAGIDPALTFGSRSPEEKLEIIESLRRTPGASGPVVMVGDGVNDVAAMAAADAGVAVGSGVRASLEVGDVCLVRDGIAALPRLVDGARRTRRVIRTNFAVSLAYNLAGAALAVAGAMNPLLAAVIMPISGLTVTCVALRATRFAPAS